MNSGSDPLSLFFLFSLYSLGLCVAHIMSCFGAHDDVLLQAAPSVQQQLFAKDKVTFHLKYDERKEISPAGHWRSIIF